MYLLETEASFDAAHFLKGYEGKCANLHGHRWRVLASIQGSSLQTSGSERGMLLDFGTLKSDLKGLADALDHSFLVEEGALHTATVEALEAEQFRLIFFPFPTTAENLSRWFYLRLQEKGYRVERVAVYETPANSAVYTGDRA